MEDDRKKSFLYENSFIISFIILVVIGLTWVTVRNYELTSQEEIAKAKFIALYEPLMSKAKDAIQFQDYELAEKILSQVTQSHDVPEYDELLELVNDSIFLIEASDALEAEHRNLWIKYEALVKSYPDNELYMSMLNKVRTLTLELESIKINERRAETAAWKESNAEENLVNIENATRQRLANIKRSRMGIWVIGHYVNQFGDRTGEKFITNSSIIKGTFSNSATEGADLNVKIQIDDASRILIKLYEYGGTNPIKGIYMSRNYTVMVQNSKKETIELLAYLHEGQDALGIFADNAKQLHDTLINGGTVKFRIIDNETPSTKYNFNIRNADGYSNAIKVITN